MSMKKIYSMYDEKAEAFNRPFIFSTHGQATRAFSDGLHDPQSNLAKHYEDYSLYCIGEFNESTGKVDAIVPPELVCRASEFVIEKEKVKEEVLPV